MVSKNYAVDRNAGGDEGDIVTVPSPDNNITIAECSSDRCGSAMAQMCEHAHRSQYRNPVSSGTLRPGRFQYLGERPVELTSSIKRYNKGPAAEDFTRTSRWSILKEAWPVLRWILVLIVIVVGLGVIIYFLVVETPLMKNISQKGKIHESQWKHDGLIPGVDDVVSLDGDVILDLGGITYHEGHYHMSPTPSYKPETSSVKNERSTQDFIEIVPAPNLGTSITIDTEDGSTKSSSTDKSQGQAYTTSRLYSLMKVATNNLESITKSSETVNIMKTTRTEEFAESKLPVSPTLPSRYENVHVNETTSPHMLHENTCFSPHLAMCRGILPYDLTTLPIIPGIRTPHALSEALPYFELVAESGCSPRARQFLCSLLEPECLPQGDAIPPPCRKACRAVTETCSDFILTALDLSRVFQCDIYPDIDDPEVCVNLAKGQDCFSNEFLCPDGTCIPNRWVCDNVNDCSNAADEANCTNCSPDKFKCFTGKRCISSSWRCDGHPDCEDASDEQYCQQKTTCNEREFQCIDDLSCIPYELRCDGIYHCGDNSDEKNCSRTGRAQVFSNPCPVGELRCLDGRCITLQQLCDNYRDCADGADEANCSTPSTVTL